MKSNKILCPKCKSENDPDSNYCFKCGAPLKNDITPTRFVEEETEIFSIGTIIDNRYKIIKTIGKGGMGIVYIGEDTKLKKKVAIKALPESSIKNKSFKKRLKREAITLSQIDHPNICNVYDVVIKDEYSYIVMQYIEGEDLSEILKKEKLSFKKALDISLQITEGLRAAHEKGIVHRDMKPSNIIISKTGLVKILDFGLAKPILSNLADKKVPYSSLNDYEITETGVIVGTVSYMSPEQAECDDVDHRTDIFSLGIILYEMFTNKKPFQGNSRISIMANILNSEPPPINMFNKKLPDELNKIINKCLQKSKDNRYQQVKELNEELKKLENVTIIEQTKLIKPRINKLYLKRFTIVFFILIILGIYFFWYKPRLKKPLIIVLKSEVEEPLPKILGEEVSFLIEKSLSQFKKYEIMDDDSYNDLLNKWKQEKKVIEKENVKFFIESKLSKFGNMINIDTNLRFASNKEKNITTNGEGTSSILKEQIDVIIKSLREHGYLNVNKENNPLKISEMLTPNWKAFTEFYHGYRFWVKNLYFSEAEIKLKKSLEYDSKLSLSYYYLTEIAIYRDDYKKAKKLIKKAYKYRGKLPDYDKYMINAKKAEIDLDFDKQFEFLEKTIKIKPRDKLAYHNLAEAYFHRGSAEMALIYYKKSLEIDPRFSPSLNHAGFCLSYLGQHIKALEFLENYKEINLGANAFDSLGDGYFYMGDYLNAKNNKKTALNIDPNLNWIYYHLSFIYFLQSDTEQSLKVNQKYLSKSTTNPNKARAYFQLAFFNYWQGNKDKAIKLVNKAVNTHSSKSIHEIIPEIYYLKGLLLIKKNKFQKASEMLKKLETIIKKYKINQKRYFPILKFYLSLKAHLKIKKGEKSSAFKIMENLLELKPKLGYWSTFFNYSYFLNDYLNILKKQNEKNRFNKYLKILNEYNPYFRNAYKNIVKIK